MKNRILIFLMCFVLFLCGCADTESNIKSTPVPERTVIPRETLAPEAESEIKTEAGFKSEIEPMLKKWEKARSGKETVVKEMTENTSYCYVWVSLCEADGSNISDRIYRLNKDNEKYVLASYADSSPVGNEYTYEFIIASFGDETVFATKTGAIYAHPDGSEECETFDDVTRSDYESVRTKPTEFNFVFSSGEAVSKLVENNSVFLAQSGSVKIKELKVSSGTRELNYAYIKNYVVPQNYRIIETTAQKVKA